MDLCPLLSVLWLQVTLAEGLRLTTFTLYTQPRVTWQSAVDFCESQGHELVRVTSQAEQDFITSMAQAGKLWNNKLFGGDTWSSLYDPDPSTPGEGYRWRLLHQQCQPLNPKTEWSNWYSNEPLNGYVDWCVKLQWSGNARVFVWRTANCNTKIRFICRHHEGQCITYESYKGARIKTSSRDFVIMEKNGSTESKCLEACSEKDFCYAAETMMVVSASRLSLSQCRLYIANGSVTAVDMERKNGTTLHLPTNCSEVKLNETDFNVPEKQFGSPECKSLPDSATTAKTTLTTALTTTTPTTPSPMKTPSPSTKSPTTTPTTTTTSTHHWHIDNHTQTTPPPMTTSTPPKTASTTTPTTAISSTTAPTTTLTTPMTTPPPTLIPTTTTTTSTTSTTRAEESDVGHGHVSRSQTVTSAPTMKAQEIENSIPATSSASTSVKDADSASTTTTPALTATTSSSKGQKGTPMSTEEMSTNKTKLCPCSCKPSRPGSLTAEQQEVMSRLMKSLVIDHKNTTARKRKLTSAPDSRQSVHVIGWLGVVVLLLVLGLVVVMDLSAACCDRHWRAGAKQNQVHVKDVKCD